MVACPKPRPTGLHRREKKVAALAHYLEERKVALARDQRRCRVCGKTATETHHIIARSLGGPDDAWNLASVCVNRLDGGCHRQLTDHIVTMRGNADEPNGLVIERWNDDAGTWVPITQEQR
jgi:5-methylcytosine-specific restriction endonuclease McrA